MISVVPSVLTDPVRQMFPQESLHLLSAFSKTRPVISTVRLNVFLSKTASAEKVRAKKFSSELESVPMTLKSLLSQFFQVSVSILCL